MNPNREIYNKNYTTENMRIHPTSPYDAAIIALRQTTMTKYGTGRDVLDLCCGTGAYLIPFLDHVRRGIGIDFSSNMLAEFQKNLSDRPRDKLALIEGDAARIPLPAASVDFVYSFTSLYYVPDLKGAIKEIERVLRPGGFAFIEVGNRWSLNTVVNHVQHLRRGWARHYLSSFSATLRSISEANLRVVERRSFQLLPMYGTPLPLFFLAPLLASAWKKILGRTFRNRMLDEWISGCWPLRYVAFRHFFLLQKR